MTTNESMATLAAGLDEEERTARAAIADRTATRWVADDGDVWGVEGEMSGPHRCDQHHPAGRPNGCDDDPITTAADVADRFAPARADHIARQDPMVTLRRVEAIRKIIADYAEAKQRREDEGAITFTAVGSGGGGGGYASGGDTSFGSFVAAGGAGAGGGGGSTPGDLAPYESVIEALAGIYPKPTDGAETS